ncbi:MAG: sulfite exporter TauE/SafE family protein [Rhizobiales bacterium]|nr:sulfite exporter TauE/SafE family protein [Hyphomicrobiales bacterium]
MFTDPNTAVLFTLPVLGTIWAGAFLGAVASGGAGFAFAITAAALWLHVLDPIRAALLLVACSLLLQLFTIWPLRHYIQMQRLWPFVAGGLIGIPIGVVLLAYTRADVVKVGLGGFLTLFGLYALLAPRLPVVTAGGRGADAAVGFAGGILGGLGGFSGVLPTIWTQLRGWPKDVARGVYQPFIIFAQFVTLVMIGFITFDTVAALLFIIALPPMVLGAWVGWMIYGRLDDRRFRQMLAVLLVASGLTLVV